MDISELKSLHRIYNQPQNQKAAVDYLESRGLPPDPRIQFCHYIPSENIRNQLLFFGKSYNNKINIVESRSVSVSQFSKLYQSDVSVPIWNAEKISGSYKNVIITEAVLDAESIQLLKLENTLAVSTYRASFSMSQFYWLMVLTKNMNTFVCYDQDKAGISSSKKIMHDASRMFGKEIGMIELSYKDPNKVLTERGEGFLRREISSQIF